MNSLADVQTSRDKKHANSYTNRLQRLLKHEYGARREKFNHTNLRDSVDTQREVERTVGTLAVTHAVAPSARAGILKSYMTGRKAFAKARRRPSTARLHEWRKQAKYLANELDMARRLLHLKLGKMHRQAERLADVLGEDHDLALLRAWLRGSHDAAELGGRGSERHKLERRIRRRRDKLQVKALRLGKRLYDMPAVKFGRQLAKLATP